MNIAANIIGRFGGTRAMAGALEMPVSTVHSWKVSGIIPAKHLTSVLAAAKLAGIGLAIEDFVDQTGENHGERARTAEKERDRDAAVG